MVDTQYTRFDESSTAGLHGRKQFRKTLQRFGDSEPQDVAVPKEVQEEWLLKARILVYTHSFLYGGRPANFVWNYLDDAFGEVYQRHCGGWQRMITFLLPMVVITFALPWIYGQTLMPNPCMPQTMHFDGVDHKVKGVRCHVQHFMKSYKALIISPMAFVLILAAKLVTDRCKAGIAMRSYMQTHVVSYLSQFTADLRHQPYSARAIPYTLVQAMFVALLLEFMMVAVIMGNNTHVTNITSLHIGFDPVAMVIGFGIARVGISLANVWLRPKQLLVQMVDAELSLAADVVFMRRLFDTHKRVFWAKMEDLNHLHSLPQLRKDVAEGRLYRYGGDHHELFEGEDLGDKFKQLMTPIRKVYIPDHKLNLVINVVTGKVSRAVNAQ